MKFQLWSIIWYFQCGLKWGNGKNILHFGLHENLSLVTLMCFYFKGQEYAKPKNFSKEYNSSNGRGSTRVKPGRELYHPPGNSWNPEGIECAWQTIDHDQNISATEFQPVSPAPLTSSRSVDFGREERSVRTGQHDNINLGARTGLTNTVRGDKGTSAAGRGKPESFSVPDGDSIDVSRLGTFSPEVEATIKQAIEDPNRYRLSRSISVTFQRQMFT